MGKPERKKLFRLLKAACLRDKGACLEELDFQSGRNLERAAVANLGDCRWIHKGQSLLVCRACGTVCRFCCKPQWLKIISCTMPYGP
jgi:hypothetical protein